SCSRRESPSRGIGNAFRPRSTARFKPGASATSEMTATIDASGIRPSAIASQIATKFEPRPESRTASRRVMLQDASSPGAQYMEMTPRGSGSVLRLPAAAIALFLAWLATLAGLLWLPLGLYDEPLLVAGGRIARAGGLPYLDFYTHYGPLGYD